MICYFAKRDMTILLSASTELRDGFHIADDRRVEDIETGQDVFSGYLKYSSGQRIKAEEAAEVGNYLLKHSDGKDEFYTIIESEGDPDKQEVYFYAESAGLDLIGEICTAYEPSGAMPLSHYIDRWAFDTGWEIGVNQTNGAKKLLTWDDNETAMARIISTAESFGMEVSCRFDIEGMSVKHKYLDFYTARGGTVSEPLRRGRDFENVRVKKSIENLCTALEVVGGTPDGAGIRRRSDDTYTWVKFSEYYNGIDPGSGESSLSDDHEGMHYIGLATGKATDEESESAGDYRWGMIRKGTTLVVVPSVTGHKQAKKVNGTVRYTWIMFATDEEGSNMSHLPTDRTYLGYSVNRTSAEKSTLPTDYTWIPIDPHLAFRDIYISPGTGGIPDGNGRYTWIKYADNGAGAGMSNSPKGKSHIGFRYHMTSATESTDPADYVWAQIYINTTDGGFVSAPAARSGIRQDNNTFLWFLFAENGDGDGRSVLPDGHPYLGIAYDKASSKPTNDSSDYEWSLIDVDTSQTVTLKGVTYDDGDIFVRNGRIFSRNAVAQWGRYVSPDETGTLDGHIVGYYESDCTDQRALLEESIAELKRLREPEVSYEIDLIGLPDGIRIGDTVPIVDGEGQLYLTARLVKLETSAEQQKRTATFSNYKRVDTSLSARIAKLQKQQEAADSMPRYTWVAYADTAEGDGIRLDPADAMYIGIAANRSTQMPELDPFLYEWTLITAGTNDVESADFKYQLVDESEDPPSAPASDDDVEWVSEEPTYTSGSTEVLYVVPKTTYTDGSVTFGTVSRSAAFAAAKDAYNQAQEARKEANNYLSSDNTGIMVADMTDGTAYTPSTVPAGTKNTFIDNDSFDVRDGQTVLASFGESSQIGRSESWHQRMDSEKTEFVDGQGQVYSYVSPDKFYSVNAEVQDAFYIGNYSIRNASDGKLVIGLRR